MRSNRSLASVNCNAEACQPQNCGERGRAANAPCLNSFRAKSIFDLSFHSRADYRLRLRFSRQRDTARRAAFAPFCWKTRKLVSASLCACIPIRCFLRFTGCPSFPWTLIFLMKLYERNLKSELKGRERWGKFQAIHRTQRATGAAVSDMFNIFVILAMICRRNYHFFQFAFQALAATAYHQRFAKLHLSRLVSIPIYSS